MGNDAYAQIGGGSKNRYTKTMQRRTKYIIATIATLLALTMLYVWIFLPRARQPLTQQNKSASTTLRAFTITELAKYDGSSTTLPIYIGLDGYVYDVSTGKKFYEVGATYHYLAGNDSSKSLHIMGGETIKQKYPIVGILEK